MKLTLLALAFAAAAAAAVHAGEEPPAGPLDPADLTVTETSAPVLVSPGDLLTFTIAAVNEGPEIALDATVTDALPLGTVFRSAVVSPPGTAWICTVPPPGTNGKVSCTNKTFGVHETMTLTVVVEIAVCAGTGVLSNPATIESSNPDPNRDDNTALGSSAVVDPGTCDDGNICTTDDRCAPSVAFSESFDGVRVRTLPPGWIATVVVGPSGTGWTTNNAVFDTPPNSVFVSDAPEVVDAVLDSPQTSIQTPTAQLVFMNRYDLEFGADGGVLEIQINGGPFMDILAAGGQFESGGYDARIRTDQLSPIGGRFAWTGFTNGFQRTVVDLPATAAGQPVVLRWRLATDQSLGRVGQWVDSIYVTGANACSPGTPLGCDDANACTTDSCDAVAGCRHQPAVCNDGNPCTDDSCDPLAGCVFANNALPCDDHDACTQTDVCTGGVCTGTNPLVCADADVCTINACLPSLGCVAPTANLDTSSFSAGRVDGRDLTVFARAWNTCPGDARYNPAADLSPALPCIEGDDFHDFMTVFGRHCPG